MDIHLSLLWFLYLFISVLLLVLDAFYQPFLYVHVRFFVVVTNIIFIVKQLIVGNKMKAMKNFVQFQFGAKIKWNRIH